MARYILPMSTVVGNGYGADPSTAHAQTADFQAQAAAVGATMRYFSYRETAGAAASFRLYLGTDATGKEIAAVNIVANGGDVKRLEVDATAGIFCKVLSGTFDLTIIP